MNRIAICIFLIATLTGCLNEGELHRLDYKGIPRNHQCARLLDLGFHLDIKACYGHMEHPHFLIGQKVHFKGAFDKSCRLIISRPDYSPVVDKPTYWGYVNCPNLKRDYAQEFKEEDLYGKK